MTTYRILFLGDVVGRPGRNVLKECLPSLQEMYAPLFTVVNGENAAAGVGITPDIADEIFDLDVAAITLGNHAFNKRDIAPYLDSGRPILRPSNMPPTAPGKGLAVVEREGIRLAVMNLCGRVFMDPYDDPFREVDRLLEGLDTPHRLVDFHAEATSEKIAMGYHLDGRVTAVLGTHTHVQTADERVLSGGTAYITDVGMTGPVDSVLGMDRDIILSRFRTSMPQRFEVANNPAVIYGVVIDVLKESGLATAISRLKFGNV